MLCRGQDADTEVSVFTWRRTTLARNVHPVRGHLCCGKVYQDGVPRRRRKGRKIGQVGFGTAILADLPVTGRNRRVDLELALNTELIHVDSEVEGLCPLRRIDVCHGYIPS